jgi:hypothetical protein
VQQVGSIGSPNTAAERTPSAAPQLHKARAKRASHKAKAAAKATPRLAVRARPRRSSGLLAPSASTGYPISANPQASRGGGAMWPGN